MTEIVDVEADWQAAERTASLKHAATSNGTEPDNNIDALLGTTTQAAPLDELDQALEELTRHLEVLPDDFWTARPALAHIRQAAHSRTRSADTVLHATLARLAAYTAHTYELPPIVGSAGSLNYFVGAIGPSGSGKSSGCTIAGELITRPEHLDVADDQTLGSGEGLAEHYMGIVEEENADGKKVKIRRQVRHNAFVYGDEGQALTAMMERRGATLPEAIRRAWTGGALGQANASTERTRVIPAGQYRLGMLIGFQPELAGQLLADANAGTPQRILWASATDPNIPDDRPAWPGPLNVPTISPRDLEAHRLNARGYTRHRLTVTDEIATEVRQDALERARGQRRSDELDSHQPLHLLKVAGLLAILDGRLDINAEDWHLAKIIWHTSCRVRAGVVAAVAAHLERTEAARIDQHARREFAGEAARRSAPAAVERLAARLARWVHGQGDAGAQPDDGWGRRDLLQRLAGNERQLADPAISHTLEQGWLTEDNGRYRAGTSRPA